LPLLLEGDYFERIGQIGRHAQAEGAEPWVECAIEGNPQLSRLRTSFAEQVAERLQSKSRLGPMLEAPTTPAVLRMLGFPDLPLAMSPSILFKLASGKDGQRKPLTEHQIARLPEYIDDPVLVMKEHDETVLVLSETTADNKPVVICIRANCVDGVRVVNSIRSAYGKDRPEEWLGRHMAEILYIGEKTNPRLTLPTPICHPAGALKTEGLRRTILGPADLRKYRAEIRSAKLGGVKLAGSAVELTLK
jgi:hypothetical protein